MIIIKMRTYVAPKAEGATHYRAGTQKGFSPLVGRWGFSPLVNSIEITVHKAWASLRCFSSRLSRVRESTVVTTAVVGVWTPQMWEAMQSQWGPHVTCSGQNGSPGQAGSLRFTAYELYSNSGFVWSTVSWGCKAAEGPWPGRLCRKSYIQAAYPEPTG